MNRVLNRVTWEDPPEVDRRVPDTATRVTMATLLQRIRDRGGAWGRLPTNYKGTGHHTMAFLINRGDYGDDLQACARTIRSGRKVQNRVFVRYNKNND